MDNCIFCKIINGEIPAAKVYENEEVIAFLDIAPASARGGHILVLPKKHYELITDIPENELAPLMIAIKKVASALLKISEGVNILVNNKRAAGQVVPHVHFHLIPRFQNDGIIIEKWIPHKYAEGEMNKVADQIKGLLKEV